MSASYRDLRVWQTSMRLVANIYPATQDFPKSELYGLVNQMRRGGRPHAEWSDRFNPPEARNVGTLKRYPRRSLKSEI